MSKPFFYRLDAATFLAEVYKIPPGKHKAWVSQLALDLVAGVGTTEFSNSLISEAISYQTRMADAGRKGGQAKSSKAKQS